MLCRPAPASPANSGKDTSLPLQALCASLAPRVLGLALRFTSPKLLRKKEEILQDLVFHVPRKLFVMN